MKTSSRKYTVEDLVRVMPLEPRTRSRILEEYDSLNEGLKEIAMNTFWDSLHMVKDKIFALKNERFLQEAHEGKRPYVVREEFVPEPVPPGITRVYAGNVTIVSPSLGYQDIDLKTQAIRAAYADIDAFLEGEMTYSELTEGISDSEIESIKRQNEERFAALFYVWDHGFTLERLERRIQQLKGEDAQVRKDRSEPMMIGTKRLFISYSSSDKEVATRIADLLKKAGLDCWLDKKDILIGEPILDRVREGIFRESGYTLIVLSKDSVSSEWCRLELRMAYEKEMKLKRVVALPIRIDQSDIPEEIRTKKYYQLDPNSEVSFQSLIEEIESLIRIQM